MIAVGSLECSKPRAWPNSWTATKNRSLPGEGRRKTALRMKMIHHIRDMEYMLDGKKDAYDWIQLNKTDKENRNECK